MLNCYLPEQLDEMWAHLRHLGRRRAQLITAATASVQRIRDFLSVAWPTVTEACAQPLESVTWLAALQVVTSRCGGQPGRLAGMGPQAFTALVRGTVPGWGGQRVWGKICDRIYAALTETEGVVVSCRRGLLRRCADELGDLQRTRAQLRAVEADMVAVLAELGLSRLADIPGLTAVGAAAILAETGDPRRYDSSSSLDGHAALSPSGNSSGAFFGEARISRRGRPGLRLTVWRAVWPLLTHNPVIAAKYQGMTQAADTAAQTAAVTSRRQPDQSLSRTRQGAHDHPPDERESEPAISLRISLAANPGQLSPGRPELLTSSVERCRGRPARTSRAGRARLHYVERGDPGDGPRNRPQTSIARHGTSACASQASRPADPRQPKQNPVRIRAAIAHQFSCYRLTDFFLRWLAALMFRCPEVDADPARSPSRHAYRAD